MYKTILLFICIIVSYIFVSQLIVDNNLIPEDAIRIRIIPHSNASYDQEIKEEVSSMLKEDMYNLLYDVKDSTLAEEIIDNNLDSIRLNIRNLFDKNDYKKDFNVNFGLNYFPEKEYKGIKYHEGYYESLVVTIGDGKGDNWWCVLFPPLCLIEAEEDDNVKYTTLVKEIIDNYN